MVKKTWLVFLFRALPLMIPPLLTRALGLHPPILNWKHILIYPALIHRDPKQLASIPSARTELLARGIHRLPLALQLELSRAALLRLVQLPGAVDGPVPQVAGSRETEGSGGERVPEEVADQRCGTIVSSGIASIPVPISDPVDVSGAKWSWFPPGGGGGKRNSRDKEYLLILLSPRGAFLLRFSSALVVEKGRASMAAVADAVG